VAITNATASPAEVTFELTILTGLSIGLTGSATVPPSGQLVRSLNQITGLESLQTPFRGVLRVATSPRIHVVGLRVRSNERKDLLITAIPPVNESTPSMGNELLIPHIVDGGGYRTQLILYSGAPGQFGSGSLRFVSQSGQPFALVLR